MKFRRTLAVLWLGEQADRILTEVSHHQTTESDFDGLDKCEPLFAATVKSFVMALVATL